MLLEQFFDPGLGHSSYLVADPDEGVAFLVDPDRHLGPYLERAAKLGVLITHSFETHVHNDYVAGSAALAKLRPITVVSGGRAEVDYPHTSLGDGDHIAVGALRVSCLATPGHTPEHVAFLVADLRRAEDPQYLFSGGALLVGQIARVDLLGEELEDQLARAAYGTLRERLLPLADHIAVFPTHGGGSACASSSVAGSRWTTLGFERRHNDIALAALGDFAGFREAISHGLPVVPAYYPDVRALNRTGAPADAPGMLPVLRDPLPADATLVDPRAPHVFALGHRRGALSVVGNDSFATRVGAVVPFGAPLVLLTSDAEAAEGLRRQLSTIGYERVRGIADALPDTGEDLLRVRVVDARAAKDLADAGAQLVDVREASEYENGHAAGAMHVPYQDLERRLDELPARRDLLLYCASGVRSSLAVSILERHGIAAANLRGGFSSWVRADLPTES
jgi:hydroxyacylglutathione hydrolase